MKLTLAELLQYNRVSLGLTLRQLSMRCGLSNPYLSQLETGKICNPSASAIWELSKTLGITCDEIVNAAIQSQLKNISKNQTNETDETDDD